MVSDPNECNLILQPCPFAQSFIQEQSSLAVQLHLAGQRKAYSLERHRLIRRRGLGRNRKDYPLEIFLRVQTEYAVCAEDKIKIAAMLIDIDLVPQLVRDEDSAFGIDYVLVLAC